MWRKPWGFESLRPHKYMRKMGQVGLPPPVRWVGRNKGFAASILVGFSCVVVGTLKASQAVLFMVFERPGKCDYLPCATTYVTAGLFALLAIGGALLLAGVLVLHRKGRLPPSK